MCERVLPLWFMVMLWYDVEVRTVSSFLIRKGKLSSMWKIGSKQKYNILRTAVRQAASWVEKQLLNLVNCLLMKHKQYVILFCSY